jgi:hypothetical protein
MDENRLATLRCESPTPWLSFRPTASDTQVLQLPVQKSSPFDPYYCRVLNCIFLVEDANLHEKHVKLWAAFRVCPVVMMETCVSRVSHTPSNSKYLT